MKRGLGTRALSFILALVILFSSMTVLSYAFEGVSLTSEGEESEPLGSGDNILIPATDGVTVQLNRSFDEGYGYSDGFTTVMKKAHSFELADDGTGNKYLKMTAQLAEGASTCTDGYVDFYFDNSVEPLTTLVVRFDLIFDSSEGRFPGQIFRFRELDSSSSVIRALYLKSGGYNFFNTSNNNTYYNQIKHTVTYKIETTPTASGYTETISAYVDGSLVSTKTDSSAYAFLESFRFGFFSDVPAGTVIGMDNLAVYSCDPSKVSDPLNVDLGYTMGSSSDRVPYKNDLFMKVGVDMALARGKKLTGVSEPITEGENAYIPVDVLAQYLGYTATLSGNSVSLTKAGASTVELTVGSHIANVGSSAVSLTKAVASAGGSYALISYRDVERLFNGYYGSYNDMGLIVVSTIEGYTEKASDMALVDVMKRFIFESIGENKEKVNVIGFEDFTAATATHPYILANADDFAYYRQVYNDGATGSQPVLYSYIQSLVKSAATAYKNYSQETDGVYTAPTALPTMPYDNNINNGYDGNGGRQSGADTYAKRMQTLAFGYQITENENYARLAYDYAIALGEWDHWGPAHFLDCADAAGPFAIAYDWLYNCWLDLGLDVGKVTEILFTHGVLAGWYGVNDVACPWARRKDYKASDTTDSSHFYKTSNNWNAVCSSGMTAAALAIAGDLSEIDTAITVKKATLVKNTGSNADRYAYIFSYENVPFQSLGDHTGYSTYADYSYNLFTTLQYTLPLYGLDFYAPDGSYVESPTYWAYSADNLFALGAYCDSVFGDDFGLIRNCWGLGETCYYALNAQSSDYSLWNYSDSSNSLVPGAISTKSFPYVAYQLGEGDLAEMRKDMVASGRYSAGYLDVFYYTEGDGSFELPALQYHMESIDGYVARDSWEPGSTYIAIKGGYNDSAHGQVDSGEFVYHNNGKIWFCDIGTEGYNVDGFGGSVTGYQYYRMNAEGNNTLALTTDPLPIVNGVTKATTKCCFAGQYSKGTGYMYEVGDNEHGAYALIDQTEVYYNNAITAKRGMLLTNDRKTVVIQDEVRFHEAETVYWIGHTYQDIYVTTDGRSAYMTDGESTIRVSLISADTSLKFDILSAYDFILDDTFRPDYALTHGTGVAESDRSVFKRLVVKCENVTSLDLAVVIEDVTGDSGMEIGYTWCPMDSWVPSADGRQSGELDEVVDFDENYYGCEQLGTLDVSKTYFVDSNMLTVRASESSNIGDCARILFPRAAFLSATLADNLLLLDMDIHTDSHADGLSLSLSGGEGEIASAPLSRLVSAGGEWAHITVAISPRAAYFFRDGALALTVELHSVSFENVRLGVSVISEAGGTVSLDNIRARKVNATESGLGSLIEGGSISGWQGYIDTAREAMPLFSFVTDTGSTVYGYTFSSLSSLDYGGKDITFYYSNEHAPVYIDKACRIIHGDNIFKAESDNLSAFILEGVTELKSESVTVYWHIGDTVETEDYVGIAYAEYKGTNENVGKITEKVVDGKHIFNATGWSLTEGGGLASSEDMLIRSDNCHFYLVDDAVDYPYFYENSKGTLIARTDTSTFLSDLNGGGKRVILNRDIEITGTGKTISRKAILYLNGYTLRFNETASAHTFNIKSGNLSIYGGGGAIIKTGSGNIFYPQTYKAYDGVDTILYVEDTTLEFGGVFMDHRTAHVYFKNVTFNQIDAGETTLVTQNRTNGMTTEENMPRLTLDGCTINHYGANDSTYAISVSKNSRLVIKGGTHINIPTGIALRLHNAYTSGQTTNTEAYIDYSQMSLTVEDAYFNASDIYLVSILTAYTEGGVVKYTATSNVYSTKIFDGSFKNTNDEERQVHILNMASKLTLGSNTSSVINAIPDFNIAKDCVFARQNDASMPYISTSDYATVSWVAGDKTVTEYWLNGSIPTADNAEVKANIAALNASVEAGKKYSYSAGEVNGEVTFTATKFSAFTISVSLTLEASMKVNLFVEAKDDVEVHGFYLDGKAVSYTLTTLDDGKTYYKIITPRVIPTSAATKHEFMVYVTDENGSISPVRIYFSVTDYCEKVLANEARYGTEARDLMANILYYIEAAHRYVGLTDTEDYKTVKTMVTKYINKVTYSFVENTEAPDLSEVTDAIRTIQLILSDVPRYHFNLNATYSGKLVLHYSVYGKAYSKTYTVEGGKCNGYDFIELELNAYDLRGDLRIETEGGEGVYNLGAYYNATLGIDSALTALLNALYAYSEKAEEYKNLIS